ncbi:MAG TPA: hypothetical protein VFY65_20525 [Longimicrobium sp.]|nr:hypothetical protein [Longimicrobium sp.]
MAKWRTIQPAHESDKITVEEAMAAWERVQERARRPSRSGGGKVSKGTVVSRPAEPAREKVAADHDEP